MVISIADKLTLLRQEMSHRNIDAYLVPSIDPHNSEYVPVYYQRRTWISNFNGSAGEVLVTMENAYLSTDGRYFLQAKRQLDKNHFTLLKQIGSASAIDSWLKTYANNKILAVDPQLISIKRARCLKQLMKCMGGDLLMIEDNIIDYCKKQLSILDTHEPTPAFILSQQYSGQSIHCRLDFVRSQLFNYNASYLILNVLDEIAWVFNLRGGDIEYNPLVISYAIIGLFDTYLFIDKSKLSAEATNILRKNGVQIIDYNQFGTYLADLKGSIWIDENTANYWMFTKINAKPIFLDSPILLAKACKNNVEISGAINAHIKDAVAVIKFLSWLTSSWYQGVDEITCANKILNFRQEQNNFVGLSFATISGFASNGAIIHYCADATTNKKIDDSSLYLLDSGGQYLEGTTDITRTIHLGKPTLQQKLHYTLVLKGHLALGRAIFPHGTKGEHLDALARSALWRYHLDYKHGTGHGVGSFLCVHEGPQRISQSLSGVDMVPGMIVSNEPGLYLEGKYGIRIENLCLVTQSSVNRNNKGEEVNQSEYGNFYKFENLTLVPYCRHLIDITMLDSDDKDYLAQYYLDIRNKVLPLLDKEQQLWLEYQLDLF